MSKCTCIYIWYITLISRKHKNTLKCLCRCIHSLYDNKTFYMHVFIYIHIKNGVYLNVHNRNCFNPHSWRNDVDCTWNSLVFFSLASHCALRCLCWLSFLQVRVMKKWEHSCVLNTLITARAHAAWPSLPLFCPTSTASPLPEEVPWVGVSLSTAPHSLETEKRHNLPPTTSGARGGADSVYLLAGGCLHHVPTRCHIQPHTHTTPLHPTTLHSHLLPAATLAPHSHLYLAINCLSGTCRWASPQ